MRVTKEIDLIPLFKFSSHQNWVNTAQTKFKTYKHTPTICLDVNNNCLYIGEDFRIAEEDGTFPVTVYRIVRIADYKNELS